MTIKARLYYFEWSALFCMKATMSTFPICKTKDPGNYIILGCFEVSHWKNIIFKLYLILWKKSVLNLCFIWLNIWIKVIFYSIKFYVHHRLSNNKKRHWSAVVQFTECESFAFERTRYVPNSSYPDRGLSNVFSSLTSD